MSGAPELVVVPPIYTMGFAILDLSFGMSILVLASLFHAVTQSLIPKKDKNLEVIRFLGLLYASVSLPIYALGGSVFAVWFWRILGARIGRNAYIDLEYLSNPLSQC